MTEIEIIKSLFKAFSDKENITIVLSSNEIQTGIVTLFDGEKIRIDNHDFDLNSIKEVRLDSVSDAIVEDEHTAEITNIDEFVSNYVKLDYKRKTDTVSTEGYVFAVKDAKLVLLTAINKVIIAVTDIVSIEITSRPNEDNSVIIEEDTSELSGFELALIDCNKDLVQEYLSNPNNLELEGYEEKEIKKIVSLPVTNVPWNDDKTNEIYNKARRLYSYVGNKHNLAQELFFQFINTETPNNKLKYKAVKELIFILSHHSGELLLSLYYDHSDYIKAYDELSYYLASALLKNKRFDEARELAGAKHTTFDFSDIQLSLSLYENYSDYDFTTLPGVDVLSDTYKELIYLSQLPNYNAYIQLLNIYSKKDKFESFFSLLSLSLPNSKSDERIVSIVHECLLKEIEYKYVDRYLPEIPLLWFDKAITQKYFEQHVVGPNETLRVKNLLGQCKRAQKYELPNEIEDAVIRKNYDLLDVFTSNDSIMLSYGYSPEEIDQLRNTDAIKYGNKTIYISIKIVFTLENFHIRNDG